MENESNSSLDKKAKDFFVNTWAKKNGYTNPQICKKDVGADVCAEKNGEIYFFEIKSTNKEGEKDKYFGAATLTEWKCCLQHPGHFSFLIMQNMGDSFKVIKYSPEQLMRESTIPPFKTNFNIDFIPKDTDAKKGTRSIRLTEKGLKELCGFYDKMKSNPKPDGYLTINEHIDYILGDLNYIVQTSPYLSSSICLCLIEFLGKCISKDAWETKGNSGKDFENALKEYPSLAKYENMDLYQKVRCGIVHSLMLKSGVGLAPEKNDLDNSIVGCTELYEDICSAWNDLKSGEVKAEKNLGEKMITINNSVTGSTVTKNV